MYVLCVWIFCLCAVFTSVYVRCPWRKDVVVGAHWPRVTDNCQLLCYWEVNLVLCKSRKCFYLLIHFSRTVFINVYKITLKLLLMKYHIRKCTHFTRWVLHVQNSVEQALSPLIFLSGYGLPIYRRHSLLPIPLSHCPVKKNKKVILE